MRPRCSVKGRVSDSLLIARFTDLIPGFNQRALGLSALYDQCKRYGLTLRELPFRKYHGLSFHLGDVPFLYINTLILPAEQIIAGWHEFAHLMYHPDDACVFTSQGSLYRLSKAERQAETIGVLALMPDTEAWGLSVPELIERYEVPRKIAEFRVDLMF